MACENYKDFHRGYESGNAVLDELCAVMAAEARDLYLEGFTARGMQDRLHMVWIGLEGDLPAQARIQHLKRHFGCQPNQLCPWCHADDLEVPHTDLRDSAKWKETVSATRPWTNEGPFAAQVPGAGHETWLAKDLFHLCHLGAIRGFAVNVLCYLVSEGVFAPCRRQSLLNVCFLVLRSFENVCFYKSFAVRSHSLFDHIHVRMVEAFLPSWPTPTPTSASTAGASMKLQW